MSFLIITQVPHVYYDGKYYSYAPYVQEMNLWLKYVDHLVVLGPLHSTGVTPSAIDLAYEHSNITFRPIPAFQASKLSGLFQTISAFFIILIKAIRCMKKADHIHLRCPGNVGLIGCLAQVFFPSKNKTAKYAGNWDWNSQQPFSYRLQQRILRNTFLTRKMTTLVYGQWPDMTSNTKSFFTASYSETEITAFEKMPLQNLVNLCFVGTLTENKGPDLALDICAELIKKGYNARITFCGGGKLTDRLMSRARELAIESSVSLLGKVNKGKVKAVLQQSHFLIAMSRSEGWPKAVAEAMFWGCVPVATRVSLVPQMLGTGGERGFLIDRSQTMTAVDLIEGNVNDQSAFETMSRKAAEWSRQYTLERFEKEVAKLL